MDDFSTRAQRRIVDHESTSDERTYSLFMHLSLLAATIALPIVIPLIMWLVKRRESPFIDDHGREVLNFQISLVLYMLAIVPVLAVFTCGVGALLFPGIYILGIVGMILGATAANRGEFFRYPMTIRFIGQGT